MLTYIQTNIDKNRDAWIYKKNNLYIISSKYDNAIINIMEKKYQIFMHKTFIDSLYIKYYLVYAKNFAKHTYLINIHYE